MDETRLKRLRWRCRRGMRELDLLLASYLERHGATFEADALTQFERLLECTDMDIQDWLTGRSEPPDGALRALIARIRTAA